MKRKKALITGAGGFSGRHLTRYLQSQSVEVFPVSVRYDQTKDDNFLADILRQVRPDYIFHLAGVASGESLGDYFGVNVLYFGALLQATREAKMEDRPLLVVGTAAEYGSISAQDLPITEETPCHPYNLYGISKLAQTLIALTAAKDEGRPVIVVRPFNIIGSGMPEHLALTSFARQVTAIRNGARPPVINVGNLETSRDFIDIEDVVTLYWMLIQNEGAFGKLFNICTGIATPIKTLVDLLIDNAAMPIEVRADRSRFKHVDIPVHYGSNQELHRLIGAFPYTQLRDTIRKIIG